MRQHAGHVERLVVEVALKEQLGTGQDVNVRIDKARDDSASARLNHRGVGADALCYVVVGASVDNNSILDGVGAHRRVGFVESVNFAAMQDLVSDRAQWLRLA